MMFPTIAERFERNPSHCFYINSGGPGGSMQGGVGSNSTSGSHSGNGKSNGSAGKNVVAAVKGVFASKPVPAAAPSSVPSTVSDPAASKLAGYKGSTPGQDLSPDYNGTDWDRVKEAAGIAIGVGTGSIFGVAKAVVSSVINNSQMTAPRGWSIDHVRNGATRGEKAVPTNIATPMVMQPVEQDIGGFFSFFNPNS